MKPLLFTLCILFLPVWAQAQTGQREAYHELSHALVAQDIGGIVNQINLDVTAQERGATYIYDRNLLRKQQAMVAIAGYMGERVFLGINNPAGSTDDFYEARRVYRASLSALYPEVEAILRRHENQIQTIATELTQTRSMTGERFRELTGQPEPDENHPAQKAEGTFIGSIGGQNIHIGGKPPWAGDGWNQAYDDWQNKFEGPLCLFSGFALFIWGVVLAFLHSAGKASPLHMGLWIVCFVMMVIWVAISTYIMYGTGPSN